ncbi:MAG: rhamnose ABC transporter substrate-binding protein [Verrucomicrobia bacterium]|jgi:rhamnose transport system substrate-binding protein|nr:rhamnose ABC transporter substrate-binding protein [Verrucomicrobiota bacterium]MBT7698990.1 rhamnose ABC transporter substrate-binding protein [Verrucomicrobiota bacterium]
MNTKHIFRIALCAALSLGLWGCGKKAEPTSGQKPADAPAEQMRLALVVKNIGNPFFDAVNKGWQEACAELNVEAIYRGPEQPTPEGQIEIMESLLAQRVDGITYVANDPQSLVNVSKKAMRRNIAVVGWESGIVPGSRQAATEPVSAARIGSDQIKIMAEMIGHEGQIAILSAAATMDNQNTWIAYMKEELKKPAYAKMKLVAVVYGDDVREKSYNEALGLFKAYPELRGIISPTSVGLAATAKAVTDEDKIGKVEVTGLGLPSELAEYVMNDSCKAFGLWNPIDLGYLNAFVTYRLAKQEISGKPGETFDAGRLGSITVEAQEGADYGLIYLGSLFRFDKENIDQFKDIF